MSRRRRERRRFDPCRSQQATVVANPRPCYRITLDCHGKAGLGKLMEELTLWIPHPCCLHKIMVGSHLHKYVWNIVRDNIKWRFRQSPVANPPNKAHGWFCPLSTPLSLFQDGLTLEKHGRDRSLIHVIILMYRSLIKWGVIAVVRPGITRGQDWGSGRVIEPFNSLFFNASRGANTPQTGT
jgi:hypothetical protein